jgi:capsular exopolysaccharide synthesis family protein
VLIIDCDMRRARTHQVFKVSQEPGLSNLLVGNAKASDAVRKVTIPNLWILPAGKTPPNPAELLGSRRFQEFMASLTGKFDWIILDTPPVMAVTDASILGHIADGVIFVVGAEMVSRSTAKAALEQLDGARVKYVGAVLNRVDLNRNGYYYSKHYNRTYSESYSKAV